MKIKVGSVVKLRAGTVKSPAPDGYKNFNTATVDILLTDIEGGLKLDRHLGGFRYWNVEDVEEAAHDRQD